MQGYPSKNIEYFYTPPENIKDSSLIIDGSEFIHITKVLRKKINNEILVVDGIGNIYNADIQSIQKNSLICSINSKNSSTNESNINVWLAIALLKNPAKMDFIIEKTTEIGVKKIIPFISEFTINRNPKINRWKNVTKSAMKQSQRAFLPEITDCKEYKEVLDLPADIKLITDIESNIFPEILIERKCKNVLILVGPEGGFSNYEMQASSEKGFSGMKISKMRLRSETAAIVAVSTIINLLQY
jgi:16S rRNA (uracil1498-N3)-methyltransferase